MIVLGIETSCDETGVALLRTTPGSRPELLAEALHSQIAIHAEFGGVVPELASRDHIRKLAPMVKQVLADAGISQPDIVAHTAGPGLAGALMVGGCVATGLAWGWNAQLCPVHHMEGHLLAAGLEDEPPQWPFVALLVSGGHSLLIDAKAPGDYTTLGRSLDDAVGEAFDKTAKLLGLPYPGGPALAQLAAEYRTAHPNISDEQLPKLPRPMLDRPGCDMSFSGLKTAVITHWKRCDQSEQDRAALACAFEQAVVDTLVAKCARALKATGHKTLVVSGGVAANVRLRLALANICQEKKTQLCLPRPAYCTDNGAMIALAGALRAGDAHSPVAPITIKPRWALDDLCPPHSPEYQ